MIEAQFPKWEFNPEVGRMFYIVGRKIMDAIAHQDPNSLLKI